MTKKDGASDLLSGPVTPTLWRFAVPLAFGFIINAVYSWTDMYFVSRLGDNAIAALGFGDQANFVLFTLGSGFAIGSGIVIARRIGEQRSRQAALIATQAVSFMAVLGLLGAFCFYWALPHALHLFGFAGETLSLITIYMQTLMFGFPGQLLTFQTGTAIRSTGNTVFPMTVLIAAALTNVIIDPILIFGLFGMPALGIKGAAISTATAHWVGTAISLYGLYSGKLNVRLYRPTIRFNWDVIGSIFRIGIPVSLRTLIVSSSRLMLMAIANLFGTATVAAYSIGLKVDILVFMPIFATGIALETIISQNIGAEQLQRAKRFQWTAARQLGSVVLGMGVLIFIFAEKITRIFTSDPEVVALSIQYLHIAVFGYVFFVVGQMGTRALSGAGHTFRTTLIVGATMFLGQVPLGYLLSQYTRLGSTGIFLGIALGYLIFAAVGTYAARGNRWMVKTV